MKRYKFLDLANTNSPFSQQIKEALARVVDSGRYVGGPEVDAFEASLAAMHGLDASCAVAVSNGLDALRLILRAYIELGQLSPGDEVIVPANTYIASVLAVTDCGLTPVFVDPDENTYNLSGTGLENAISPRTKAIMPVHLYGRPAWDSDMARVASQHGLMVVEDNAQAIGAVSDVDGLFGSKLTGTLGHAAAFSFYPTKNLGALGDAGAVISRNKDLTAAIRALRNYGSDKRYNNIYPGLNCRMDPLQAAILGVKLPFLTEENTRRRELAEVYQREIAHPYIIKPFPCPGSVWHQFVVRTPERDRFRAYLADRGVETDVHYPLPPYLQPCYRQRFAGIDMPVSRRLAETVLSLPMGFSITNADAKEIAAIINGFLPVREQVN